MYDSTGARVKKTASSTTTVYLGKDYDVTGALSTKYIFLGDRRVASKDSSNVKLYFHEDHINSSNVITDSSGNQAALYEYDPYGLTATHTGATDVKHQFTGQEKDDSTHLHYYGARYYDSQLGRFVTADDYVQDSADPQSFNRYAYARNNPIIYTDPDGHFFFIPFIIAAIAFAAAHATEIAVVALALMAASLITGAAGATGVSKGLGIAAMAASAVSIAGAGAAAMGANGGTGFVEQVTIHSLEKVTQSLGDGVVATTYVPHTITITVINSSVTLGAQAFATAGLSAGVMTAAMVKTIAPDSKTVHIHYSEKAADDVKAEDVQGSEEKTRGSRNPKIKKALERGLEKHKELEDKVRNKPGWKSNPRVPDPETGSYKKPDVLTPSGRPIELKPNTESGRAKGAKQLKDYERLLGKKGKVVYY